MELKTILNQLKYEADYLSLREMRTKVRSQSVRNEIFDGFYEGEDCGIMVEVMIDGHFGYAATDERNMTSIQHAVKRAESLAKMSKRYSLTSFSMKERPVMTGEYVSPHQKAFSEYNTSEMSQYLNDISTTMNLSDKILNRQAYLNLSEIETRIVSNHGSDAFQKIYRSMINMWSIASDGSTNQKRSWGYDQNAQGGMELWPREKVLKEAKRVATESLELLTAEECPTGTMDLMLHPDQLYLQIHESIGHPLELDRILGDERNYAGWSFVKPNDFGNLQYGSKLMNITFDPTLKGQNASYLFDDTGAPATKEHLIKDGKLLRGLGSLESQKRLGLSGVASQRATSWNRPPIDRMANVNLEPGNSSFDDMIKSVEKGVYMISNRSWSIDDYRNKFQFGCEYGKLIENGKITKTVRNPNYRGVTTPFWNNLKMVGDQSTFEVGGLANCGKGEPNQVIFVGHASPICLFSNIEVFGGGK